MAEAAGGVIVLQHHECHAGLCAFFQTQGALRIHVGLDATRSGGVDLYPAVAQFVCQMDGVNDGQGDISTGA